MSKKKKQIHIIGFPIISKLIRGHTVELENVCFIPDDQLLNESKNNYGCIIFDDRCKHCPYKSKCKENEVPGSDHCFAVLQRLQ